MGVVVPRAMIRPFTCVGCTGSEKPLVDTGREIHGYGRVYVCENCAMEYNRDFGFTKGKRMQELSQAARLLTAAQTANETQSARIQEFEVTVADLERRLAEVTADNDNLASHAESLRQRLKDITAQTAALAEV